MKRIRIDESARAKTAHATVTIDADPLEIELDAMKLAKGPAEAIARAVTDGIRHTAARATAGTIAQRKRKGIASDKRWNATGMLARSIVATPDGKGYAIGTTADRLQDPELLAKFLADVPEASDPMTAAVEKAVEKTADEMIVITVEKGRIQ